MPLVSCAIMPHGTMILDPERQGLPEGAAALHSAALEAARRIARSNPTHIVLITPHFLSLSHSASVLMNSAAEGTALWNGAWDEFTIRMEGLGDAANARRLVDSMRANGCPAEGITTFSGASCPLRWAEVVPLHFLKKAGLDVEGGGGVGVLIVSPPARGGSSSADRSKGSKERIPINIKYGATLFDHIERDMPVGSRTAVIVSGDLSHVHDPKGITDPLYLPDPRWNMPTKDSVARQFDSAVARWVVSGCRRHLVGEAADLVADALSCGFDGVVWLLGGLEALHRRGILGPWKGEVLENIAPSYFGMMVASFDIERRCEESNFPRNGAWKEWWWMVLLAPLKMTRHWRRAKSSVGLHEQRDVCCILPKDNKNLI